MIMSVVSCQLFVVCCLGTLITTLYVQSAVENSDVDSLFVFKEKTLLLSNFTSEYNYYLNFARKLPLVKFEVKLAQLTWSDDCCSKIQVSIFSKYF